MPEPTNSLPTSLRPLRTGTDPVLNELMILNALEAKSGPASVQRLQTGALMSVIDAFDRRIQRPEFCQIVYSAMALHSHLARIHLGMAVETLIKQDLMDSKKIEEALRILTGDAESERISLYKQMELVVQCPTAADSVS